jgi:ribosome recycling factor
MAQDEILMEAEEKMEKSLHKVQEDFGGVRTGKASSALVENIKIETYGTHMRLKELAGITTPEPRLILVQPWDAGNVDPIRKALEEAKIGVTPQVDGKLIRLPIPELSEERRKELVKVVRKIAEDCRVAVRHIRRDALDMLKKEQKEGSITEDGLKSAEKEVQNLHDQYIKKIDDQMTSKEAELLKV